MALPFPQMSPPGGDMATMIGELARYSKRETSQDKVRRAVKLLEEIRKEDDKVGPVVSAAIDILRGGPELERAASDSTRSYEQADSLKSPAGGLK